LQLFRFLLSTERKDCFEETLLELEVIVLIIEDLGKLLFWEI